MKLKIIFPDRFAWRKVYKIRKAVRNEQPFLDNLKTQPCIDYRALTTKNFEDFQNASAFVIVIPLPASNL